MAYFESLIDGVTLYSATVTTAGQQTTFNTSSFTSCVLQISGLEQATINVMGSNNGTNWNIIPLNDLNDFPITDIITTDGAWTFKNSFPLVAINVVNIVGSAVITVVGRSGGGAESADKLAAAFDPNTPFQVSVAGGILVDSNKAIRIADGLLYSQTILAASGNAPLIFDCLGYAQISISQNAGTAIPSYSVDGINYYSGFLSTSTGSGVVAGASATTAGTSYTGNITYRYIKISPSAYPCAFSILLKFNATAQFNNISSIAGIAVNASTAQLGMGLVNIGASAIVTGGVAGLMGVGGNIAAGVAPTANPVPVGGIDPLGLTRRLYTDTSGRASVSGNPSVTTGNTTQQYALSMQGPGASAQYAPALQVQDTTMYEGSTQIELLMQILLELRILNQQYAELPTMLNYNTSSLIDSPDKYRQDPTFFNLQNNNII